MILFWRRPLFPEPKPISKPVPSIFSRIQFLSTSQNYSVLLQNPHPDFIFSCEWPSNNSDFNSLDYSTWSYLEAKENFLMVLPATNISQIPWFGLVERIFFSYIFFIISTLLHHFFSKSIAVTASGDLSAADMFTRKKVGRPKADPSGKWSQKYVILINRKRKK